MLRTEDSPLRLLVKSYTNGIIERDQYLKIRAEVLKKLSIQGEVSHEEVKNFIHIQQDSGELEHKKQYSPSDWIIIALGLIAALIMGLFLYS
jgi:endo-1,4-beta-mannosidase